MDTNTRNALILGGSAVAGVFAGRWITPRIGAALGLTFGPWGSIAGATIGAVLAAALTSRLMSGGSEVAGLIESDNKPGLKVG